MVAPGDSFYITRGHGKHEIRVAFILDENTLKRVAELLAIAVRRYNIQIIHEKTICN